MNCEEARVLIHPYADGELDLVKTIELERHLETCSECPRALENTRALQSAIRNGAVHYELPSGFEKRMWRTIWTSGMVERRSGIRTWKWIGLAASLAVASVLIWFAAPRIFAPSSQDGLAAEILQSHVRSLMLNHLTDVQSTDQHTVKPWFDGKIDFSPEVRDFTSAGFALIGGRLDYIDGHPAAALVYQRRKHIINVFVWRTNGQRELEPDGLRRQGYNGIGWVADGMTYCAVSDLNESELQQFVQLIRGG